MIMLNIINVVVLLVVFDRINSELYTAIIHLEPLIKTEQKTIADLESYIMKEEEKLNMIRRNSTYLPQLVEDAENISPFSKWNRNRYLYVYKTENNKAMKDIPNYIGNPINAYRLIKRLTVDLNLINTNYSNNASEKQSDMLYPDMEDLIGAVEGFYRLQETYELEPEELARGIINGTVYSNPMTASDCFQIGRIMYKMKDYNKACPWMIEAFRRSYQRPGLYHFTDDDILDVIDNAMYQTENIKQIEIWLENLLEIGPDVPRITELVKLYLKMPNKEQHMDLPELNQEYDEQEDFKELCRGEYSVPLELSSKLTCRYLFENHPYLLLAPIKMEYLHVKPDVVLYYNVLYDDEIEDLKSKVTPKLDWAKVVDDSGKRVSMKIRITKTAWLSNQDNTVARTLNRMEHITGLNMEINHGLHINNYGIAGHYVPHFDFFDIKHTHKNDILRTLGNRIVTVLFYLSDVALGGETVFIRLGVKVTPIKGSALVFYNLLASGEPDFNTRHAACPVLYGTKWVATRWIHMATQELARPCNLKTHTKDFVRAILRTTRKSLKYEYATNRGL